MVSLICGILKIELVNIAKKKKKKKRRRRRAESQIQRTKLMVTRGGRGGAGQDRAGEVESTKYWV